MFCKGNQTSPDRRHVSTMFDGIAGTYDRLNRWLSFGQDVVWRRECVRHAPVPEEKLRVLDLATGTGDILISFFQAYGSKVCGAGLDFSGGMLAEAREKLVKEGMEGRFCLVRGDATCLGIAGNSFDVVTIGFGVRNLMDAGAGLEEMHRVLRPSGRVLILEFSLPSNRWFRGLYLFYFRHVLPRLGGVISGDRQAYRYLNQTVETFPYGEAFLALMRAAGFKNAAAYPLTWGIATLYAGDKE